MHRVSACQSTSLEAETVRSVVLQMMQAVPRGPALGDMRAHSIVAANFNLTPQTHSAHQNWCSIPRPGLKLISASQSQERFSDWDLMLHIGGATLQSGNGAQLAL